MVEITYQMVLSTLQTIALIVGITYYLFIMRNSQRTQQLQLETRQAQLFQGVFNRLDEEWWTSYWYILNTEWSSYAEFSEKLNPQNETELGRAHNKVWGVFEYLGVLVREGLLNIRLVALQINIATRMFWEKHEPIMQDWRMDTGARIASESEYLYKALIKYNEEHPELKT